VNVVDQIDATTASNIPDEPYPGLRSFRRDETHIFFGREGTISDMVNRLAAHRFLAVTGTSGSGKSSLVRTGLLDALTRGLLAEAGSDWRIADFRPGGRPLEALTKAVIGAVDSPSSDQDRLLVEARLARGPSSLVEWLDEIGFAEQSNLLLLVDQFEELFRYQHDRTADEVDAFVALLLSNAGQRHRRIYVVITMRSDFLGECARFAGLAEAINDGQFLTPRLSRAQCEQAIEGPATVYGGRVEKALVNRLLNDMGTNPDQLPLMQHVLMLMWRAAWTRSGGNAPVLTLAEYEALGGIPAEPARTDVQQEGGAQVPSSRSAGALSNHADEILAELTREQQRLAAILFRALTQGEGAAGRDVRRPVTLLEAAEVAAVAPEELIPIIEAFRAPGRHFLTPALPAPLAPETVIDISHESLIRQWGTLREWVRDEFESAERYRHLERSAKIWEKGEADLLGMPYLGLALAWREREHPNAAWAARYGSAFPLAMRFLDTSQRRYRRRRFIQRASLVGVACTITFAAIGVAIQQYVSARDAQARIAQIDLSEELPDFKIAPQTTLQTNVGSATPTTIPGAKPILTPDLDALLKSNRRVVLVDALYGKHETSIPSAIRIFKVGLPGTFEDDVQFRLARTLRTLTSNKLDTTLVFFCAGMRCWESYNAALRALRLGYTDVLWYRGGLNAWRKAELPTEKVLDRTERLQAELTSGQASSSQRHIVAIDLEQMALALAIQGLGQKAVSAARSAHDTLKTLAASRPADDDLQLDLADSTWVIGEALESIDDFENAVAAYREAISVIETMAKRQPDDARVRRETASVTASVQQRIAAALKSQYDYAGAIEAYQAALRVYRELAEKEPATAEWQLSMAATHHAIGEVLRAGKDYKGALAEYRAELAIYVALAKEGDAQHGFLRQAYVFIGFTLEQLNDPAGALAAYREALPHAKAAFAEGAATLGNIAWIEQEMAGLLRMQGSLQEALTYYRDAVVHQEHILAEDNENESLRIDLMYTYNRLGEVLVETDNLDEARDLYAKSEPLRDKLASSSSISVQVQQNLVSGYSDHGDVLALHGQSEDALGVYRKGLPIARKLVDANRDNAEMRIRLAALHLHVGVVGLSRDQPSLAVDQFATATQLTPSDHYAALWLHLARLRAGRSDRSEIQANAEKLARDKWPWPIVAFYLGLLDGDAVRAEAERGEGDKRDRLCEADFYRGVYDLATGARETAAPRLQSAAQMCRRANIEYLAAKLELSRLQH
jgi:PQQ-dependent catabolism-associated CXXCW motif protein